MGFPARS